MSAAPQIPQAQHQRVLFVSNGHGEDDIACKILDQLLAQLGDGVELTAWPMVGRGKAYQNRGIALIGPGNHLPSEGFGTVSLRLFLRDVLGGFIGTYLRQIAFARRLRHDYDLLVGVGDIVPLAVSRFSGIPICFVSCAKSVYYGGKDGHNGLERGLMRRDCLAVFPRDAKTAQRLQATGIAASDLGNPMMDGLDPVEVDALRGRGKVNFAMLAGSRTDATRNTLELLAALPAICERAPDAGALRFLFAAHGAVDFAEVQTAMAGNPDWQLSTWDQPLTAPESLCFENKLGAKALLVISRFADILHVSEIAIGMAGTANEQAIGLGIPLIALPGTGNQGEGFQKMKGAYFGAAVLNAALQPQAIAEAVAKLRGDVGLRAEMAAAGRERMGPAGASRAIAGEIADHLANLPNRAEAP